MSFRVSEGQQLARINARHDGRADLTQFEPDRYSLNQAAIDYGIEEAKRIKHWPALEEAVDAKIAEQIKFVAWWNTAEINRHIFDAVEQDWHALHPNAGA